MTDEVFNTQFRHKKDMDRRKKLRIVNAKLNVQPTTNPLPTLPTPVATIPPSPPSPPPTTTTPPATTIIPTSPNHLPAAAGIYPASTINQIKIPQLTARDLSGNAVSCQQSNNLTLLSCAQTDNVPETTQNNNKTLKFPLFSIPKVKSRFEKEKIEIIEIMMYANGVRLYKAKQGDNLLVVKTCELDNMTVAEKYFQTRDYHFRFVLRHKRIVRTFHLAMFHNVTYSIMEYAQKGSLDDILHNYGPMSENYSVLIFYEVCKALEYMHKKNIAHRNIKTDNILFTHKNIPKLTDFKYCVEFDGNELLNTFVGNAQYLAPEVLIEQPYNPFPADIWALGVCLFLMINDSPPFKPCGNNMMLVEEQKNRRLRYKRCIENDISKNCKELISRILDPCVETRLTIKKLKVEFYINSIVKLFVDQEKARRGLKPVPDVEEVKNSEFGTWYDLTSVATQFRTNNDQ